MSQIRHWQIGVRVLKGKSELPWERIPRNWHSPGHWGWPPRRSGICAKAWKTTTWSQGKAWGKGIPVRGLSMCKGPEGELKEGQRGWRASGEVTVIGEGPQGLTVLNSKSRGSRDGWPSLGSRPRSELGKAGIRLDQDQLVRHPGTCQDPWPYLLPNLWARRCPGDWQTRLPWRARTATCSYDWKHMVPDSLFIPIKTVNQYT